MDSLTSNVIEQVSEVSAESIEASLKILLEDKHLYQNFEVEVPSTEELMEFLTEHFQPMPPPDVRPLTNALNVAYDLLPIIPWAIHNPSGPKALYFTEDRDSDRIRPITITPPSVRLYCSNCADIEPYNFLRGEDYLYSWIRHRIENDGPTIQGFVLSYLCQGCKETPELLLVRRRDLKITLCGRSPIEQFPVPSSIPRAVRQYYSDAIIAFNSGQVLAANFLLRTLVEQFARAMANQPQRHFADEVLDEYVESLPDDFKQRFPSLREVYSSLSNDIHLAEGSSEVFVDAKGDIERHFEARRLFEL